MGNDFDRYQKYKSRKNLYKVIVIGGIICCIAIICILSLENYLIRLPEGICLTGESLHGSHTYKLGKEDAEYVTIEQTGPYYYTYYFHKTPDNPKTDYFVTYDSLRLKYPPISWRYLKNDSNKVFVSDSGIGRTYLDTVVSNKYKFISAPGLLKEDTLKTPSPINDKYLNLLHQRIAWKDSMFNLPVRIDVGTHGPYVVKYRVTDTVAYVKAPVISKSN